MNRSGPLERFSLSSRSRHGYTLIEVLVATTLSLMILGGVIHLFSKVGASITESRSILESAERLRGAQTRMQLDLEGLTVLPLPPRRPDDGVGCLEIFEGPMMQANLGVNNNTPGAYLADFSVNPPRYSPNPGNANINVIPEPVDTDKANARDTSVGDVDDILFLTTRSSGKPFTGRFGGSAVESNVAEVAWFVRGNTLYRRQLLVAPNLFNTSPSPPQLFAWTNLASIPAGMTLINPPAAGFYAYNDISVRTINVAGNPYVVPNSLSDLTRRECRYGHPGGGNYDARAWSYLGLPTAKETSDPQFVAGVWDTSRVAGTPLPTVMGDFYANHPDLTNTIAGASFPKFDYWTPNPSARLTDSEIIKNPTTPPVTYQGSTVADDVILTNVIGFDVKVWDPGFPILQDTTTGQITSGQILKPGDENFILPGTTGTKGYSSTLPYVIIGFGGYVDLGYYPLYNPAGWDAVHNPNNIPVPQPNFSGYGRPPLTGSGTWPRVYDTWCNTYDVFATGAPTRNGFDDGNVGIVDNDSEPAYFAPYPAPMRGIQVKIRIFEPDSRQVREVTIEQDFLPK
jgi:type II secretory pathway component PulJ